MIPQTKQSHLPISLYKVCYIINSISFSLIRYIKLWKYSPSCTTKRVPCSMIMSCLHQHQMSHVLLRSRSHDTTIWSIWEALEATMVLVQVINKVLWKVLHRQHNSSLYRPKFQIYSAPTELGGTHYHIYYFSPKSIWYLGFKDQRFCDILKY